MLGAVIGDLAVDTWNRDKALFYCQLIDDKALPSVYGVTVLKATGGIFGHKDMTLASIESLFLNEMMHSDKPIFDKTAAWTKEYYTGNRYEAISKLALVLFGLCGWANNDIDAALKQALRIRQELGLEKEEWYAANILPILVCRLRNGDTKKEALYAVGEMYRETFLHWHKEYDSLLGAIARAWDAFYRAFDFTSTIHSAVKSPVNPRLTATIAGMLADAMYGCEQGFLKNKYTDDTSFYISCPREDLSDDWCHLRQLREKIRLFFPKNRALTNVERHIWIPIFNPYQGVQFGEELLHKIRMAFDTGWEDRYGIYLDDGWYYVYRSYFLLNRFRIVEKDYRYEICDVQRSNDPHTSYGYGLNEAIYSIECPMYGERKPFLVMAPGCRFRYFKGEDKNPFDLDKEKAKARFWHGEKMYFSMVVPDVAKKDGYWIDEAKRIRPMLHGQAKLHAEQLRDDQLAILIFVETLYRKWCPMDEYSDWLYEY